MRVWLRGKLCARMEQQNFVAKAALQATKNHLNENPHTQNPDQEQTSLGFSFKSLLNDRAGFYLCGFNCFVFSFDVSSLHFSLDRLTILKRIELSFLIFDFS